MDRFISWIYICGTYYYNPWKNEDAFEIKLDLFFLLKLKENISN
jgi:hypothetical protein